MTTQQLILISLAAIVLVSCGEEQVDAFYYPNKNNLTIHEFFPNVGSVDNCRAVVSQAAAKRNDANLIRGDYECCVGPTGEKLGEITICKETVK
jgi:hypothetical protein